MPDKRLKDFTALATPASDTAVYVDRGGAVAESERATCQAVVEAGATSTPAANRVPRADVTGKLAGGWLPTHAHAGTDITSGTVPSARLPAASTSAAGVVELATDGETAAGVVVQGNDGRLSNARTPTAHSHAAADVTSGTLDPARLPVATTTAAGAVELATDGESAAGVVVQGNDGRLSNARTPTAHSHAATDVTSGTLATARLGSGSATADAVLRGDQTWGPPPIENPWGRLRVTDHFAGGTPWSMWVPGGGGGLNPINAEAGHPGVAALSGAATLGPVEVQYSADDGSLGLALASDTERFGYVLKIPDLSSVRVEVGLSDVDGFNSVLVRYESSTGKFSYRAIVDQVETVVTDNTTTTTTGWWRFEVVLDHVNGTASFYANGSLVGSISGGSSVVPLGSQQVRPIIRVESLHASQVRSVRVDLFWFSSIAF